MTTTDVKGRTTDALRAVLDDLRRMNDSPRVRLALGEGEFRLAIAPDTSADEAIVLLRSAITHDPFLAKCYLHLGRLLHRRGRYRAAMTEYLAGLELAPTSRRIHLLLAEALLELGKQEQQIGEELIFALAERSNDRLRTAVSAASDLLGSDSADGGDDSGEEIKPRGRATRRRSTSAPSDFGDMWLVWLLAQLGRPAKTAQVDAALRAGAAGLERTGRVEFAIGSLLVLLACHPPELVRKAIAATDLETVGLDSSVGRALTAVLQLAEAPNPATFLRTAATCLTEGVVPAIVVYVLHYERFGPDNQPLIDALRMVDAYPAEFQPDDGLQELRIALLDQYAAKAWDAGVLTHARLLWRETLVIDPYRVPAAVNLALLAAKLNATGDYESAWERLFELLYLLAAGVGDVQLMLAERRDMHLALARQSWLRHCAATPPSAVPGRAELEAWLVDADALAVWLRDWDGYYVNARLAFRSPLHLLAAPRDVSTEGLADARDALKSHIDAAVTGRGWAGTAVFRELAVAAVEDAYARTVEPIDRTRDLYFESEKERAEALASEIVHRTLVLLNLIGALARLPATRARAEQAAAIVRHKALLPQAILRSLFVDRGLVERDIDPAELFEDAVVRLAAGWLRAQHATEPERTTVATCFDAIVGALPGSLALRVYHAQSLYAAKRPRDAYATSVTALGPSMIVVDERTPELREVLLDIVDRIGLDEVPSELRGSTTVADAEKTIRPLTASLERYPASAALRGALAGLYLDLDRVTSSAARQRRAAELLVEGIVEALDDRQSEQLTRTLAKVASLPATDTVRAAARELARRPSGTVATAVRTGQITRCLELARERALTTEVAALEQALEQPRSGE